MRKVEQSVIHLQRAELLCDCEVPGIILCTLAVPFISLYKFRTWSPVFTLDHARGHVLDGNGGG
jgi:hypothetical protein